MPSVGNKVNLASPDVVIKYKGAAEIVNDALKYILPNCKPKAKIVEICELTDQWISKRCMDVYKNVKGIESGISFPTCISINNTVCNFSPVANDVTALEENCMMKIEIGCHVDGFIAVLVHTHIVQGGEVTGRAADVLTAANRAAEIALDHVRPGKKSKDIKKAIEKVAAAYDCRIMEGFSTHKLLNNISNVNDEEADVEFEENEAYVVDIVASTGKGKPMILDKKQTTIYRCAVGKALSLRRKELKSIFKNISKKFPLIPFTARMLGETDAFTGLEECVRHELLKPYHVLCEEPGALVARIKYTVLLLPSGADRITAHALQELQPAESIEDSNIKVDKSGKMKRLMLLPGRRRLCKQVSVPNEEDTDPHTNKVGNQIIKDLQKDEFVLKPSGKQITAAFRLPYKVYDDLYEHQREGLRWLWGLHCKSKGGILADDMGLGKTRQVSAFLAGMFHSRLIKTALVLAPTTVLHPWAKELAKVDIGQPIEVYSQAKPARERSLKNILEEGGVLLASYDMYRLHYLQLNGDGIASQKGGIWDYVILDEGHKVKNPKAKISCRVKEILCTQKVILTGTPIQNNLEELHALFMVCCPSILGDKKTFKKTFLKPIDEAKYKNASNQERCKASKALSELKRLTSPYMLRRTKQNVLCNGDPKDHKLPKKTELTIWLKLTPYQEKLYRAVLTGKSLQELLKGAPLVTTALLKKICNHPLLLTKESSSDEDLLKEDRGLLQTVAAKLADMVRPDGVSQIRHSHSCKIAFIVSLLENILENYRVLIFSQTREMLDLIQESLSHHFNGYKILRMDGTTKPHDRAKMIDDFQENTETPAPIFLLTTHVGALGITLTKASRVVIVDPAWNPSIDNQSVDRVYRIGKPKTEDVVVYRLMTCGTVEEKTYKMQVLKGSVSTVFTEKRDHERYFNKVDLCEFLTLPPHGFDISPTHLELEKVHGKQFDKVEADDLRNHIMFLEQQGLAGITNHSKLFSKVAKKLPDQIETNRQDLKTIVRRCYSKKSSSEVVVGGADYAFEPNSKRFTEPEVCIISEADKASQRSQRRQQQIKFIEKKIATLQSYYEKNERREGMSLPDEGLNLVKKITGLQDQLNALLKEEHAACTSGAGDK